MWKENGWQGWKLHEAMELGDEYGLESSKVRTLSLHTKSWDNSTTLATLSNYVIACFKEYGVCKRVHSSVQSSMCFSRFLVFSNNAMNAQWLCSSDESVHSRCLVVLKSWDSRMILWDCTSALSNVILLTTAFWLQYSTVGCSESTAIM